MSDGNSPSSGLEERLKLHDAYQKPILGPRGVLDKMRTSDCVLSGPTVVRCPVEKDDCGLRVR